MKKAIFAFLIVFLAVLVFASGFFIEKKFIPGKFTGRFNFLASLGGSNFEEIQSLKNENEILRAQIQKSQIFCSENNSPSVSVAVSKILSSRIFSNYPFNIKNVLTINAGSREGVKNSMTAAQGQDIFLGQVTEVFENYSTVRTIFDPDWQLAVKIGNDKINGLFKGGNEPKITLIEKPVKVGDPVFTSGPGVPLDLKIGEIGEIREGTGGVFKEAIIKVPYNINQLETVNLLISY